MRLSINIMLLVLLMFSCSLALSNPLTKDTSTQPSINYNDKKNNECNDGKDNDGDGSIDWQLDLGCYGSNDLTEGGLNNELDNGWTVFEPSVDTRIVYVSSTTGNDKWSGTAPEWNGVTGPKKTIKSAIKNIRENSSDWLLFKRGDVWKDEVIGNLRISGRSEDKPFVISSYGNSKLRPRFDVEETWLRTVGSSGASENRSHVRLLGLHIYMYSKDPFNDFFTGIGGKDSRCIQWLRDGGDVLIEDMKCEYGQVSLQSNPTKPFTIRRNVFSGSYSLNSHSQSLYSSIGSTLMVEENIFNHGGWNDDFRIAFWNPEDNHIKWAEINSGCFDIELEKNIFHITGLDLTKSNNMDDVANIIEAHINKTTINKTIELLFTKGGAFKLSSSDYLSSPNYGISTYTGEDKCSNISDFFMPADSGTPASTVFNRNMYIAFGNGKTVVRNNIDANGASGGIQQRMGGVNANNLYMRNPISISFGANENPGNYYVGGIIKNNVILGSRDIDTQPQGTGIFIQSRLKSKGKNKSGHSRIKDLHVYGNIISHNELGTGNGKGIYILGKAPIEKLKINNNIVFNWANNKAERNKNPGGFALVLELSSGADTISIENNIFQQYKTGYLADINRFTSSIILYGNTYWSNNIYRASWLKKTEGDFHHNGLLRFDDWILRSSEKNATFKKTPFYDPNRTIESYMQYLGKEPTYEAFIKRAIEQSKYNWDSSFSANVVNNYIREGFIHSNK